MSEIDRGLFESGDEAEEFLGFTEEDIARRRTESDGEDSGDSDISVNEEETSDTVCSEEEQVQDEDAWSNVLLNYDVEDFENETGPTNILPVEAKAYEYFLQMFPEDLIELIVTETNRNAEQKQQSSGRRDNNWSTVNAADIRAYIAIRFYQGIKGLPSARHYWSQNKLLRVDIVANLMPRNRYLKITEYLHFNDSVCCFIQQVHGRC